MAQVTSYMTCPRQYQLSKEHKLVPTAEELYQESLHKTIQDFWLRAVDGKDLSMAELKYRWENTYKLENEHMVKGVEALWKFHLCYGRTSGEVLAVGVERPIKIGDHIVTVPIDVVRRWQGDIEVISFKALEIVPKDFTVYADVDLTAASFSFRTLYRRKESRAVAFYIHRGQMYYTNKEKRDYQRLVDIVDQSVRGIESGVFPPRHQCEGCRYQRLC